MKILDGVVALVIFVVVTMIMAVVLGLTDTNSILVGIVAAGLFVVVRLSRAKRKGPA